MSRPQAVFLFLFVFVFFFALKGHAWLCMYVSNLVRQNVILNIDFLIDKMIVILKHLSDHIWDFVAHGQILLSFLL